MTRLLPALACAGLLAAGCGYAVGAGASRLPAGTGKVFVPALENRTSGFCVPHLITIARGDKVRMIGWSPEKEMQHLTSGRQRTSATPARLDLARETTHS